MMKVMKTRDNDMIASEHSAVGDSDENDMIENACQSVRYVTGFLMTSVESRADVKFPSNCTIHRWNIRWAAELDVPFTVERDGGKRMRENQMITGVDVDGSDNEEQDADLCVID